MIILVLFVASHWAQAQLQPVQGQEGYTLTLGVENSAVPDGICQIADAGAPLTVAQNDHQGRLVVVQDNPHTGLILYRLGSTEITAQVTKLAKQISISLETQGDVDLTLGLNERDEVVITTKQDGHDYPAEYAGKPLILMWVKGKQSPKRVKVADLSFLAETKKKEGRKTQTNGEK